MARELNLTYFDAIEYRELGFIVTQLTFDATSLHATDLYEIGVAPAAPVAEPEPAPTSRVIVGSFESLFSDPIADATNEDLRAWGNGYELASRVVEA